MFSAKLIKGLALAMVLLFMVGCGGKAAKGGAAGGRATGPTEEQRVRLDDAKASAEASEAALYEKRLERIELERQLEDRQ